MYCTDAPEEQRVRKVPPLPLAGRWCCWRPMRAAALCLPAQPEAGTRAPLHSTCQGPGTSRCCSGRDQKIPTTHSREAIRSNPCGGWAGKGFVKVVPHCQCCSPRFVKGWLLQKQDFSKLLLLFLYLLSKRYWATPYLMLGDVQM